ncbi:MAG: DUF4349 domain-containing protein [Acidimicrobiia bacterium]
MGRWGRWIGFGVLVLVLASAVVGLSRGGGHEAAKSTGGGAAGTAGSTVVPADVGGRERASSFAGANAKATASAAGVSGGTAAPAPDTPPGSGGGAPVPGVESKIVHQARLDLTVPRRAVEAKLAAADAAARQAGGFVERSERAGPSGTITVRVPAEQYGAVLAQLRGLGHVRSSSQSGDDVTGEFVDRQARIRNLQAQEAVLQDLMRQARSIADTITVQQQLAGVQEQIEQLQSQQNLLDGQASFATITATFRVAGVAPAPRPEHSSLAGAWDDAVDVTVAVMGGMVIVVAALLPFGVLAGLGFAIWSVTRRRRPHLGAADA